jgi:hypothetical protein
LHDRKAIGNAEGDLSDAVAPCGRSQCKGTPDIEGRLLKSDCHGCRFQHDTAKDGGVAAAEWQGLHD